MPDETIEQKEKVTIRIDEEVSTASASAATPTALPVSGSYIPNFAGRYELMELIGEGGMGLVYKVRDPVLDKVFAIKVLRPSLTKDAQALKRFEKEAASAVGFDHPGLVAVYETGCLNDGTPFILMDYVDGSNLADVLKADCALTLERSLAIFQQILDALEYVHERGLTHRDVKPRNIILRTNEDGSTEVKLVDFGIAKIAESGEATTGGVTQTGDFLGSPLYMSPEQCQGRELTRQSDIYSAGCVLYEMLTGQSPFFSPNPVKIVIGHLSEPVAPIRPAIGDSAVWSGVNSLTLKCLEKTTDKRYQSVAQIRKDLNELMESKNPFAPEQFSKYYSPVLLIAILLGCGLAKWQQWQFPEGSIPIFFALLVAYGSALIVLNTIGRRKPMGAIVSGLGVVSGILMTSTFICIPGIPSDFALIPALQAVLVGAGALSIFSTFKFARHPESFLAKPMHAWRQSLSKIQQRWFRVAILSTVLFAGLLSKMPESQETLISGSGALYVVALSALLGGTLAIRKRLQHRESTLAGDRWLLLLNGSLALGLVFSAAAKAIAYLGSQFSISTVDASQWETVLTGLLITSLVSGAILVSIYKKRSDSIGLIGKSDGW